MSSPFHLWATGCPHVGTDKNGNGRESLADAIRDSERGNEDGAPPFEWDVGLVLGDFSGTQTSPNDEEGEEVLRQFGAAQKHGRED